MHLEDGAAGAGDPGYSSSNIANDEPLEREGAFTESAG